jgi:hypothetical protein
MLVAKIIEEKDMEEKDLKGKKEKERIRLL